MPQLRLEYSSNVIEKNNFSELFRAAHAMLSEKLPTEINTCKSRAIECGTFYIGDGHSDRGFVHVSLKVLPGRGEEILKNVGESMMEILKNYFSDSQKKLKLQITLELMELKKTYFKFAS